MTFNIKVHVLIEVLQIKSLCTKTETPTILRKLSPEIIK